MATKHFIHVTEITCSRCGQTYPVSCFYVRKSNKTGRETRCKPCLQLELASKVDPEAIKKTSEKRPYFIARKELENGRTLVKFGDMRPNFPKETRSAPARGIASSLLLFDFIS